MRQFTMAVVLLMTLTTFVFAQKAMDTRAGAQTIKGTIIDNQCAGNQTPEQLASFLKGHTKSCTLMPGCIESGYSIFADGKLMKFDKESNTKIVEFLKKADSSLDVVVVAKKAGELLSLDSIENQQ